MVGAAFDHFRDVLRLLVDGHGSDNASMRRRGGQLDLDWTCLGNLTVELLQQGRVLVGRRAQTGPERLELRSTVDEWQFGVCVRAYVRKKQ